MRGTVVGRIRSNQINQEKKPTTCDEGKGTEMVCLKRNFNFFGGNTFAFLLLTGMRTPLSCRYAKCEANLCSNLA